jgi:recombinational DNA repair ATPase RecF
MHIRRIHLHEYKRFTELIVELPAPARLVMMCGPNGSGKSSLLEAIKLWHDVHSSHLVLNPSNSLVHAASGFPVYVQANGLAVRL